MTPAQINRRAILAGLGSVVAAMPLRALPPGRSLLFLNTVGPILNSFGVEPHTADLSPRGSISLSGNIQFAWRHPNQNILYAITSSAGEGGASLIHAVAFDRNGVLRPLGQPMAMPSRANHMSVDNSGRYILTAHPTPCEMMVHRILPDFSVGPRIAQPAGIDFGLYAHEVRATPSGQSIILVDRGNDAEGGKPENPGSLRQFEMTDGILSPRAVIAPNGGFGFGARDIEFHPNGAWLYVSLERQSKLYTFAMQGERIDPTPRFIKTTLEHPDQAGHGQMAGDLHFHPDGRSLYVANRGDLSDSQGRGESNIARFSVDPQTGEPTLAATSDTLGFHPRTFSIDPAGDMLIAANVRAYEIMDRGHPTTRPPSLTAYRIGADGSLTLLNHLDIPVAKGVQQYWSSFLLAG